MKCDHLLYSPSLTGYFLTKPLVRSNLFFNDLIVDETNPVKKTALKIVKLFCTVLLGTIALVGMAIKYLDFQRIKLSNTPKVIPEESNERIQKDLANNFYKAIDNNVSAQDIYNFYREGLNFSKYFENEQPVLGNIFYTHVKHPLRNNQSITLNHRHFEAMSALIQCGAKIPNQLMEYLAETDPSSVTYREMLAFCVANNGNLFPESGSQGSLLDFAMKSEDIQMIRLVHHLNPTLIKLRNYKREGEDPTQINQFLRHVSNE